MRRESVYYPAEDIRSKRRIASDFTPAQNRVKPCSRLEESTSILNNLRLSKNTPERPTPISSISEREKSVFIDCLSRIVGTETLLEDARQQLVS
jgi:hypothetical protein